MAESCGPGERKDRSRQSFQGGLDQKRQGHFEGQRKREGLH